MNNIDRIRSIEGILGHIKLDIDCAMSVINTYKSTSIDFVQSNNDKDITNHRLDYKIKDVMYLNRRIANALFDNNIIYVGDLISKTSSELLHIPNFGRKSLVKVNRELSRYGLKLGMDTGGWERPLLGNKLDVAK